MAEEVERQVASELSKGGAGRACSRNTMKAKVTAPM